MKKLYNVLNHTKFPLGPRVSRNDKNPLSMRYCVKMLPNKLMKSPDDLANYTKEIKQLKSNNFVEKTNIKYKRQSDDQD